MRALLTRFLDGADRVLIRADSEEPDVAECLLKELITDGKSLLSKGGSWTPSELSQIEHVLGLAEYRITDTTQPTEGRAVSRFLRALDHDSGNLWARLFAGHVFFDRGEYSQALEIWSPIRPGEFRRRALPAWRDAKLEELRAVCRISIGEAVELGALLDSVAAFYLAVPEIERPVPVELGRCLRGQRGKHVGDQLVRSSLLAAFLSATGTSIP